MVTVVSSSSKGPSKFNEPPVYFRKLQTLGKVTLTFTNSPGFTFICDASTSSSSRSGLKLKFFHNKRQKKEKWKIKSTEKSLFHKGRKTTRGPSLSLKNRCCNDHKDKNIYGNFIKRSKPKSQSSTYMDVSNFRIFQFWSSKYAWDACT